MTTEPESLTDLTRWNRAGLERFQYTDGNAANWLDLLRDTLRERLAEADLTNAASWPQLNPEVPGDTEQECLDHLELQYLTVTSDHGWEILRAFARAVQVCTAHLDAYSNEGYLRTATQWESLRRLVATLDYSPTPAASASTSIALLLDDDLSGTVAKGLQLNDKPTEGSPATFETLADLDADARLNQIHLKDWNKSQELFRLTASSAPVGSFPIAASVEGLSAGSLGVLQVDAEDGTGAKLIPLKITSVSDSFVGVTNLASDAAAQSWKRHELTLHTSPKKRARPLLGGDDTVVLAEPANLGVGEVLAWHANGSGRFTRFLKVKAIEDRRMRVELKSGSSAKMPDVDDTLYRMTKVTGNDGYAYVPLLAQRHSYIINSSLERTTTTRAKSSKGEYLYSRLLTIDDAEAPYWYVPDPATEAGTITAVGPSSLEFSGKPKDIATNDPMVVQSSNDSLLAATVQEVAETDEGFEVVLEPIVLPDDVTAAYWNFQDEIRPTEYDINATVLTGGETLALELTADDWPDLFTTSREVILHDAELGIAALFKIATADPKAGIITLSQAISTALDTDGKEQHFTTHGTVLLANIVSAGQGETNTPRVLGSGDSTNTAPTFDLDFDDVSFVADPLMPNGVRADVEVTIGNRTWTQVGTIRDSVETDSHYDVRPLSEGGLHFRFNRRLPTGTNNVMITVRRGVGLAGNLDRDALVKLKEPHSLVAGVLQPFDATGGGDVEPASSMRENAPESVLTLDRAVSMSDFAALAASHASIWQAQAFAATTDRPSRFHGEMVQVVAVPAGGGLLENLSEDLRIMLQTRAMPGVVVQVVDYTSLQFDLAICIRLDTSAYDPDEVTLAVRTALESAFAIERRPLATSLYRSQIYSTVEAIEGVKDSTCQLVNPIDDPLPPGRISTNGSGAIRALRANDGELLHVRTATVSYEEYTP